MIWHFLTTLNLGILDLNALGEDSFLFLNTVDIHINSPMQIEFLTDTISTGFIHEIYYTVNRLQSFLSSWWFGSFGSFGSMSSIIQHMLHKHTNQQYLDFQVCFFILNIVTDEQMNNIRIYRYASQTKIIGCFTPPLFAILHAQMELNTFRLPRC